MDIKFIYSYILQSLPFLALFLVYFIRIEHRLTRIETNIDWLIKYSKLCQPNSVENIV